MVYSFFPNRSFNLGVGEVPYYYYYETYYVFEKSFRKNFGMFSVFSIYKTITK